MILLDENELAHQSNKDIRIERTQVNKYLMEYAGEIRRKKQGGKDHLVHLEDFKKAKKKGFKEQSYLKVINKEK